MKCLRKYQWVKLPRDIPDMGKGLMAYWAMLAFRAAFRKGNASYCGHSNPVAPGMWAGGVVGLKSILGVRSRTKALQILGELSSLGFLKYSLDSQTKKLTYEITDWVVKCSGAECMSGTVYASTGYGFLCLPRNITQRLANAKRVFDEADAWLDLWCHTTYEDYGNAFSFLAPVVQYGRFGSVLTLETLGERWGWEKTKVWRFFKKHGDVFSLYRLPSSYGCLVFNASYPTGADIQLPEQEIVMRILRKILICSAYKCKGGSENLRVNHMVAWYSRAVILSQQMQPVPEISECRVALSDPITRAYLSHGWNCEHCRNYHYCKLAYEDPSFVLADYGLESEVFAVISIPALELEMPVFLGANYRHMADGAALLGQTSIPIGGKNTNCIIAGHRGWGGASYFRYVDKLQPGDEVIITNLWETLQYRVAEIQIIQPNEVEQILIKPGQELVTLLTCHPYASGGRQRYLVICERVNENN